MSGRHWVLGSALLLILLAALLWPAGGTARADAPPTPELRRAEPWLTLAAQPRFTLWLTSSRNLCTAGTLTEVSWNISGGSAPYRLTIEGEAVDANAENIRINCGALTDTEAADEQAALAAKTVTAVVTDSRGVRREAALEVARAKALPAPAAAVKVYPSPNSISFEWLGAGGSAACDVDAPLAVRWRRSGATEWNYGLYQSGSHDACKVWRAIGGLQEGVAYEAAIAALRDSIESESPEALQWTNAAQGATVTTPSGVAVSSTHDSVTVRWNRQPSAYLYVVSLAGPNGGRSTRLWRDLGESAWGDATSGIHEVVFRHLPSDTAFAVYVTIPTNVHQRRLVAETRVRTKAAPAAWTPPPRGAQNLRASATSDSITVRWDAPFAGADDSYKVTVYHPRYPSKPLIRWVYRNEFSQANLEAGLTYRVIIEHEGIVRAPKEIRVTTGTPAQPRDGAGPTGEQTRADAPPVPELRRAEPWLTLPVPLPRLALALQSSRDLCTAGTLTEISWQISGGAPPYTLGIEGESTDPATDNIRINCGALTETEAADEEAALAAKTITAVVTDSRGVQRTAALDVARARALPAPADFTATPLLTYILTAWTPSEPGGLGAERSSVLRWRRQGSAQWTFVQRSFMSNMWTPLRDRANIDNLNEATVYELSVADTRTAIEGETPEALNWTPVRAVTTLAAATNVRATATHDTITVRWDPQAAPDVTYLVAAHSLKGGTSEHVSLSPADRHEFTLSGLPPDTEHRVFVHVNVGEQTRITEAPAPVRTLPAPPDWTAPLRGAQNVRATATHDSITVRWDPPRADATPLYIVFLFRDHDFIEGQEVKVRHVEVFDATAVRLDDLSPSTAHRIVISHGDAVVRDQEVNISTTAAPAATGAAGGDFLEK